MFGDGEFDPQRFIENIETAHPLPGPYLIKVVGPSGAEFEQEVVGVIVDVCSAAPLEISRRQTKSGRHVGLTLTVQAQNGRDVLTLYERLGALAGVKMVL